MATASHAGKLPPRGHDGRKTYSTDDGQVFLPVERGRYLLTHVSAAHEDCELCGSKAGEPCVSTRRDRAGNLIPIRTYWIRDSHHCRRKAHSDRTGE